MHMRPKSANSAVQIAASASAFAKKMTKRSLRR